MEAKRWLKGNILVLRILSCGKACIKAKQSNSMYAGEKAETKKKKKHIPHENCEPAHHLHSGKWAVSYFHLIGGP